MRVYIKPDLEGITGVVLEPLQTSNTQTYYQEARRLMTADVNAVAKGAVKAGQMRSTWKRATRVGATT